MTLPISPNSISLMNLQLEYGGSTPIGLNEYYGRGNAPSSGPIGLANFLQSAGVANPTSSGLLFELDARNSSSYSASGTTWFDTTVNDRDFTLVNSPTFSDPNKEFLFDGTNDYVFINDAAWIPEGTSAKTFECYVKMNAWRTGQIAFLTSKTSPNNQSCSFGFKESSGVVTLVLGTQGGGNFSESTDAYTLPTPSNYLNSYHQYGFTYDGSVAKMYIDGSLVFTSASGKAFHSNTAPMRLMVFDPSNASFTWPVNAYVKGIRMYDRALSDAEISTNYSSWTGPITPTDSVLTLSPSGHSGIAFTTTFTFSQNVADFTSSDITVTNGIKGTFTGISTSQYTLVITPSPSNSNVTIGISSTASYNAGNRGNNALNSTITYSTFISTNLVTLLDATNSSSYSGSGTTWFDVAGNPTTYNATLLNGPTFNNTAPKSFSFDGSDDRATMTRPIADDFTIACWFKTTWSGGDPNNQWWGAGALVDAEVGGSTTDFGLSVGGGKVLFGIGSPDTTIRSTTLCNTGSWFYITATRQKSTGNIKLYINSSLEDSTTGTNTSSLTASSILRIGDANQNNFTGTISQVQIWSSVLSASDITSNWNTHKGTYGY